MIQMDQRGRFRLLHCQKTDIDTPSSYFLEYVIHYG